MRTIEEFRDGQIEELHQALRDPVPLGGSAQCADRYFSWLLSQLLWIDERSYDDWKVVSAELLFGPNRVYGQFASQLPAMAFEFASEIASTYAQVAYRLGYYSPDRLMTEDEFKELKDSINHEFMNTDHTRSELVSRFGAPTHSVFGGPVDCYGCANPYTDWVYFDYECFDTPISQSGPSHKYDDPVLRDVRRSDNKMELLPFGVLFWKGKGPVDER